MQQTKSVGDMLKEICRQRRCSNCPLEYKCPFDCTPEDIEKAYDFLFGKDMQIQECDILSVLEG